MLRGREKVDPFKDSLALALKVKRVKPETEPKMEIIKFFLEVTVVMVGVSSVAALTLASRFASSKNPDKPSWGSE